MPAPNFEEDIKSINASLKQVNDQLKATAEQAQKDLKAHAQLSEESKLKADELLVKQGEISARLQAAEQMVVKLQNGGAGGDRGRIQSLGELVAGSEEAKAFNPQMKGSFSVQVPRSAITSDTGSAGDLITPRRVPGIVATPQQRLFVRDLLTVSPIDTNAVEYVRETGFTNNAAPVAENPTNPKPESDIAFELDSAKVVTIAHWVRASKQVLRNASTLQGHLNGRLLYGLRLVEEAQILKGSGTGLNMNGIWTQASAYANPGVSVQNETIIDRLRIALLQVTLAEYESDGIVLNPVDWTTVELTKASTNEYVIANPRGLIGSVLWGRPVVPTKSLAQSEFLTGAFQLGAQLWENEAANITVSNQDRDNFVKNMVTILAEMDEALTVYRPEAFVKGDFDGLELGS